MTDLLRFNAIYDATVAVHYTVECSTLVTTLEILVPQCHNQVCGAIAEKLWLICGSGALKAPTTLFKLVVHKPKLNFLQQLLLKTNATFSEF